jgi:HSP20 family protein
MKKRSFFERLAGNLRFDDNFDDNEEVETPKSMDRPMTPQQSQQKRELTVNASAQNKVAVQQVESAPEEVGELPVDMYENGNEIIVQTLIAGVLPENLSINITRDMVSISGRREENKNIPDENYHIRELYWGAFARTVELPDEIDIAQAEAIERHGMLVIKLPKIDKNRRTVLKIKSI